MIQFGSTQRLDIIAKALHEDEQSEWVCALAHSCQPETLTTVLIAGIGAGSLVVGPVNIGSDHKTTVAQVARTIARPAGRPDLLRLGALPTTPDDPPYLVADVARLTQEVGFRPTIALADGLRDAVQWWHEQTG